MHSVGAESPLTVIVADDDALARRAVRDALQADGVVVIAEAASGREAVELSRYYQPDVLLMDLVMPEVDGIQATRAMHAAGRDVRVVIFSSADDEELGLLSLRAGAVGFISKSVDLASLPRALRAVNAGEAAISRRLTMRVIEGFRQVRENASGLRPVRSPLSEREWEVLDLLCSGDSTDVIADRLVLSPKTIRTHVKNIVRKLGVGSRAEAIEQAHRVRTGLIGQGS